MKISEFLENNLFNFVSNMDFSLEKYEDMTIIGLGVGILNGLSYEPIEWNVTVLTTVKEMHNFNSGLCRMISGRV